MGAHRLAFRPRRAFAGAAIELGQHGRVGDVRRVDVADARLVHRSLRRAGKVAVAARTWLAARRWRMLPDRRRPINAVQPRGLSRQLVAYRGWSAPDAVGWATAHPCPPELDLVT